VAAQTQPDPVVNIRNRLLKESSDLSVGCSIVKENLTQKYRKMVKEERLKTGLKMLKRGQLLELIEK
jgi:hypothetical protein